MSDSESSSSSSELGGSSLTASQWNRERSRRGVQPLQRKESIDIKVQPHPHLLKGRYYPRPKHSVATAGEDKCVQDEQTELEKFVLKDCLFNHFLLSHLPNAELERLCNSSHKVKFRPHEIIYSTGDESKYMYILYSGDIVKVPDVKNSNESNEKYTVLGELAVITGTPYRETAQALSSCTLLRIDRDVLHRCLLPYPELDADKRISLLKHAIPDEVMEYMIESDLHKLASCLEVNRFQEGDVLLHKKDTLDHLVIIAEGTVSSLQTSLGEREYESQSFGPDSPNISFGWQSILEGAHTAHFQSTIVAQSDGVALILPRSEFQKVLGSHDCNTVTLEHLAARRLARLELTNMPIFQDSLLDEVHINALLDLMHRYVYESKDGEKTIIYKSGDKIEPALYFVREGSVTLEMNKGADCKVVQAGDYFGEYHMLRDQNKGTTKHCTIRSPMTASVNGKVVLDLLYLEELRSVIDTTTIGLRIEDVPDDTYIDLSNIKRHALLGSGSFGQVWLATTPDKGDKSSNSRTVAFKVQSKHQILESGKAERMVAERNILASLNSPFLLRLYNSFQDESRLYLVTSFLQGGELESLIPDEGMPENSAKFYAAGILEGLAYMHRRHLLHRDIKTANVLLNEKGYPVIIDFGFAKYVPDKTFTFVGSPIYSAPEIIRFQGYGASVDYWAWGVLVYRLTTGRYPFFVEGNELELYKRICRGSLELDGLMSMEFRTLITSLLYPNPNKRIGNGHNGWREIRNAPWFTDDTTLDLGKLRRQTAKAPWVPELRDELDASSFHPDESEIDDLMIQTFLMVDDERQQVFAPFGPWLC